MLGGGSSGRLNGSGRAMSLGTGSEWGSCCWMQHLVRVTFPLIATAPSKLAEAEASALLLKGMRSISAGRAS